MSSSSKQFTDDTRIVSSKFLIPCRHETHCRYFFSSFLLHLFQREPTLLTLRSITSTPLLFFLPDLFCSILRQLTDSTSQRSQSHNPPPPTSTTIFTAKHLRNSLEGKIITFFPLLVFFGGLYYTDLVGMGGVLLVYHLSMKEGDGWAGIVSTIVGGRLKKYCSPLNLPNPRTY